MPLPQLSADKANHFLYGAVIYTAVAFLSYRTGFHVAPKLVGLVAVLLLGTLKEVWDAYRNKQAIKAGQPPVHSVDPADAIATYCGGILCFLSSLIP